MSTALDVSIKVLYVQGRVPDVDAATTEQLRAISSELHITTIAGSAAALAELRRTPGWQALLSSPSLPHNEILALITSLRRDRIPIAIVPIVDESHQDLFASAVASGADDVLVQRAGTLLNINETLARIRQSPHLFPAEQRRRIGVLYAGRDPLVWNLLDQVPFVKAERVSVGVDGGCPVRRPGSADNSLRADAVIVDEQPGDAHPLQVLKSVKAQASDLPVIVLTSAGATDIATAALELGADDTVLKTGIFRRRLIATLRRVHQRLELTAQQIETKTREERLRQIVENVPTGILVLAASGNVLAMNAAALQLFGAGKPRDIVGRDFRQLVEADERDTITELIRTVAKGEPSEASFEAVAIDGSRMPVHLRAVVLERDARGGRGVVASITRVDPQATVADDRTTELGELRDALQRMEQHFAELEDARANERTAWESERQRLEGRLEHAERLAAERALLEERLDEVTAELARASQSFAEERQTLEARLQELESSARQATTIGAERAELERALHAVREEQQHAVASHAIERSGWQEIRSELEARVRDLGTAHDESEASTIAALRSDVHHLEQTLADERTRWDTTRTQLEDELRNAREALWAEHNERDTARAASEAELTRLRDEAAAQQTSWDDTRATLERTATAAQEAADAAQRELAESRERFDTERRDAQAHFEQELASSHTLASAAQQDHDAVRARLEQEINDLRAALDGERATWGDQRSALEAELRRAADAEGAYRELVAVRSRLEAELEEARQQMALERGAAETSENRAREAVERAEEAHRALVDEYDATRIRLEQERDEARRALDAERLTWDDRRTQLEAGLASVSNQAQIIQQRWEADREERERAFAEERADVLARAASAQADRQAALDAALRDRDEAAHRADALLAERDDAARRAEALLAERDEAQRRVEALITERNDVQHQLDALGTERDDAQHRAADRDALDAALEAARRERDEATQHAEALLVDRDNATRRADELLAERDEAQRRIEALSAERNDVQYRLDVLGAERDDAQQRAADRDALNAALEEARRERDEAGRRADALLAERDNVQQRVEALVAERDDVQRRLDALAAEHDDARHRAADRDALDAALEMARRERDEAAQRADALLAERDDAARRAEALLAERDDAQRRVEALVTERDDIQRQLDALGAARDEAQHLATERDALNAALEAARDEIRHTDDTRRADREAWEEDRRVLERQLHDVNAARDADRDTWNRTRAQLEADVREAAWLNRERQRLDDALTALRADYASVVQKIESDRSKHVRDRIELDAVRSALAEAEARQKDLDDALDRAARSAEAQLSRQIAQHDRQVQQLEAELRQAAEQLARSAGEAERARAALHADYQRASSSHARLIASDVFGYAVTTGAGELVRCNDAFARMFGFVDAHDALARTVGCAFGPLANRPEIEARLRTDGRIDQVPSCVERVDGRAVRIVETAVVLSDADETSDAETIVEHVIVAGPAGPTAEELHARRLQEVGALTAAMMPEVESIMAAIHQRSTDMARRPADRDILPTDVDGLRALTAQIAALIQQLAAFSRRQVRAPESIDLGETVASAQPMLAQLVGDYITFSTDIEPTPRIKARPEEIEQMLTSLSTQARDLLPAGGSVVVRVSQDASRVAGGGDADDLRGPTLSVTASGYGAQQLDAAQALEQVAQRCGGRLRVTSDPGWSVRLEVVFPRCGFPSRSGWDWLAE